MTRRGWTIWACTCTAWLFVPPAVFGFWLATEVDAQYTSGVRTSTDGDSISLPIAGVAVLNFALVVAANLVLGVYFLCRRYLTRGSSRPPSAAAEP
jgi:hypothetical protein